MDGLPPDDGREAGGEDAHREDAHRHDAGPRADLKALVATIARALADDPAAVRVSQAERRGMTVVELQVAPGDLGRVIGRQGRTAGAVRTLLAAVAENEGTRATLDIRDANGR